MTVRTLTRLALLLAITLAIQMIGLPQYITGPAINAMLVVSTLALGPVGAAFIGMLTPVIAFMRGILPPVLAPAIPFIVLGNWAIIFVFAAFRRSNQYLAVILGALAKYLVLAGAVTFFLAVPPPVAQMLQLPQLLTALVGGVAALLAWNALVRTGWDKKQDDN